MSKQHLLGSSGSVTMFRCCMMKPLRYQSPQAALYKVFRNTIDVDVWQEARSALSCNAA
jgi:hypothetical protein